MILFELQEHRIIERFDGAGDQDASGIAQKPQQTAMPEQVLDFDGRVVSDLRKFGVQRFDNFGGMRRAVEEIRIAEGDVARAAGDLAANVFEYDVALDDPKLAAINRNDGTVPAQMFAAAAGFGVGDLLPLAVVMQARVAAVGNAAIGRDESQPVQ